MTASIRYIPDISGHFSIDSVNVLFSNPNKDSTGNY